MEFLSYSYDHQVDAKNRIRIPSKLKGNEKKLFFTKGDDCIYVYYESEIAAKMEKLRAMPITDSRQLRAKRMFANSLTPVEVDAHGRFVIPVELVAYAKIKKDVKICGTDDRIEIWATEVYDEYMSQDDAIEEAFISLGLI